MRGKDNVGATMDFMDLERQRGITIQVENTSCIFWYSAVLYMTVQSGVTVSDLTNTEKVHNMRTKQYKMYNYLL